jgi:hypothetical protein
VGFPTCTLKLIVATDGLSPAPTPHRDFPSLETPGSQLAKMDIERDQAVNISTIVKKGLLVKQLPSKLLLVCTVAKQYADGEQDSFY